MISTVLGDSVAMDDQTEEGDETSEVLFKCAWRGKRGSLKRHPMHTYDVIATDADQVSLVGWAFVGD